MENANLEKKRKRGKRGGKKKEVPETIETKTEAIAQVPVAIEEDPEPQRKKTRRSKKKVVEEIVEGAMEDAMEFEEAASVVVELDHETRNYFLEIEKQIQKEFENEQDLAIFISNVFEEVDGREVLLACDYEGSRVLEKLLKLSNDFQLRVFADRLNGSFYDLVRHSFGSHVCQTLLNLGSIVVEREVKGFAYEPKDIEEEEKKKLPSMQVILQSIAAELQDDIMDAIFHSYASHVIRTLLNVLAGNSLVQDSKSRSKKSAKYNQNHDNTWKDSLITRVVPTSFQEKLREVITIVIEGLKGRDINDLITHPVANPVIQILVSVPQVGPQLSAALLQNENIENSLIKNKVGSHLMEKLITYSNDGVFKQLYKEYFKDKLKEYAEHAIANFVVQKLIVACKKERYFKEMVDTLKPNIQAYLFKLNRSGIVHALLESCIQYPPLQGELAGLILDAFECTKDQGDVATIILHYIPRSAYEKRMQVYKPTVQGSLILQHVCKFSQPHCLPFISSIVSMEVSNLLLWIQDPISSHIVDNVMLNEQTPNKLKKNLIESFYGSFFKLATDKYASRFVDKCWNAANLETKEQIAEELIKHKSALLGNFTGKFVYRNCHLDLYARRKEEWLNYYKGLKKKTQKTGDEIDDLFANKR